MDRFAYAMFDEIMAKGVLEHKAGRLRCSFGGNEIPEAEDSCGILSGRKR